MDTAQHEGPIRRNISIESQEPSTYPELRDPSPLASPVESHDTSTAVPTEYSQTGSGPSCDVKTQFLRVKDEERSNKGRTHFRIDDVYHQGDTVFKKDMDAWRAYKVERFEFHPCLNPDSILVHGYFLDFDKTGNWLVPQLTVLVVSSLSSKKYIEDLDVIPGWYFDDHHSLRKKLMDRGLQYASYARGVFYREYTGDSWPTTPRKDSIKVIVDYTTASKHGQDANSALQCIDIGMCSVCSGEGIHLQSYPKGAPHDPDICQRNPEPDSQTEQNGSNYGSLLFCPPKLWAFSMSHKCWKMVLPEHLNAVQRQDEAIDELWMIPDHKDCLESMLSHLDPAKKSPDTKGVKGRGLNILLTGNTGTGKTFTVETLAKKCGVPLYKIACGDLGSNPDILELRFNEAMLRAANWGAILLLDEADIFITRALESLPENVLVSIFLRQLERSECVFFMTTHTVNGMLDEAIRSRLHLTLRLPDLTLEGQKAVWARCIRDVDDLTLSPRDKNSLDHFIRNYLEVKDKAFIKLNGRQIKNCVTAALAYAQHSQTTLTKDHIEMLLRLGKEFKNSLSNGFNDTVVARGDQLGLT
ncbi:hypothetical protein Hte_010276 [Hypoxylon texense]